MSRTSRGGAASTSNQWIARALIFGQVIVVLMVVRNWAYVTTYRLYLEHRIEVADQSIAAQQFDIEGDRVVPRIVTRGADRLAFKSSIGQDSTIHAGIRPGRRSTTYAIEWRDGSSRRVLARGTADAATTVVCPFPTGSGVVELVSDGSIEWVDPRIVRDQRIGRHAAVFGLIALCSIVWARRGRRAGAAEPGAAMRLAWFKAGAVATGATIALIASEVTLRALIAVGPLGIMTERHDLGEVTRDTRGEDSPRYGRRHRPGVDVLNEWRYGDIVRMGFVPPAVSDGTLHQFRFQTDAEGFRNPVTRAQIDIAALGDSFTDALTMPVEASWPMQLERRLGVRVQNYGTAGFGPQQELLVLKDFAARHRPAVVVLAFFAGNDIFNAEAFEELQRSDGMQPRPGWRIKDVVSRADTWYIVSAIRAGVAWLGRHPDTTVSATAAEPAPPGGNGDPGVPSFDRGMFTVPVGGAMLRFAFMPPYLNTLNFSEDELAVRRGFALTRDAIVEMQQVSRSAGADFIVMFLPFKAQAYLPTVAGAFSADDVRSAFRFYLDGSGRPIDLEAMMRNRLAQNRLMRRLCEEAGIPFVDTTAALESRVAAGENVYFPDESHLNEYGQSVVAEVLAGYLRGRPIRQER
jgi:lysophospholipase L1-like esterase